MLFRHDGDAVIAIPQPAHAWVSGQLARAWGGKTAGRFEPWEEVCLAAEQHDIGWLDWETRPTLNRKSGLPHTFRELPTDTHIEIWSRALRYGLTFGRYSALLISMHGTGLYERYGPGPDKPEELRRMVAAFLDRERAAQQRIIESLAADPRYADLIDDGALKRNQRLVGTWDYLSLLLCGGLASTETIPNAPGAEGAFDLTLAPTGSDLASITVDPWPFRSDSVTVTLEGRRLAGRFEDEDAMRDAYERAEWVRLPTKLRPA